MVQDPELAVAEAYRVLKTGGEIFVIGLRSDADYDKIIGKFVPDLPVMNSDELYRKPIERCFGEIIETSKETFSYFFETKDIALDAFLFALRRWYSLELSQDDQRTLIETIAEYKCGEQVRIDFPADIYRAVKV